MKSIEYLSNISYSYIKTGGATSCCTESICQKNVGGYPVGVPTYVTAEQLCRLMGDKNAPRNWPIEARFPVNVLPKVH